MDLYEHKQRLHKLVEEADDPVKLYNAMASLEAETELAPEQEAELDKAIAEADAGMCTIPAEEVLAELEQKVNEAFSGHSNAKS